MFDSTDFTALFLHRVMMLIPLWLSLSVHEWAHAFAAYQLGDDTADQQGRMTVNPLAHLDPVGTVFLPLMGVPFGWAKPVPVEPTRFRSDVSMSAGIVITAAAGPLSNVLLAGLTYLVLRTLRPVIDPESSALAGAFSALLMQLLTVNIVLAIGNLLPIPPLDGSRIVDGFIRFEHRAAWARFATASGYVLAGLITIAMMLWGVRMVGWITGLMAR
jgi:Zn-dependent protease